MSFTRRIINVTFKLADANGSFDAAGNNSLTVKNLRSRATIQSTQGGPSAFLSQLSLQIWGMKNEDMASMSTLGLTQGIYTNSNEQTQLIVQAGDQNGMVTVFSGVIYAAHVDYNQQPEVPLIIYASATQGLQLTQLAPSSYKGSFDVATMLQGICASAGLTLVNHNVTAKLAHHCASGSAHNQIVDICQASGTCWGISPDGKTLTIWPMGEMVDDSQPIELSPGQGMVGYPEYSVQGINVVSEFNPNIMYGKRITVQSSTPKPSPKSAAALAIKASGGGANTPIGASGTFYVNEVVHDLSCNLPDGPWYTRATLGNTDTRVFS